jgi:hypothetical protein
MKKYFLSFSAVMVTVLLVAFIPPKPQEDMFYFYFDGTNQTYTEEHVENESNTYWKYLGKNLALCSGEDPEKACRVRVTGANVDNTTTPTELRNVVISAEQSGPTAHVTGITEIGSAYSNEED